jgi:pimeloyl-ACP methyl ester carboxylesterase
VRAAAIFGALGALVLTAATVVPASGTTPGAPGNHGAPGALHPLAVSQPLSLYGTREAIGTAVAAGHAAAAGIRWKKCPAVERLPSPVRCGKVAVPVDYARPRGAKIHLTVSRGRASGPTAKRQGPLLYNPGGPGGSGMLFPLFGTVLGGVWKKLNSRYDFVGYAPRGVGRSGALTCGPKTSPRGHHSPLHPSAAFKKAMRAWAAGYAEGCAKRHGARLDHYTTPDNARDLDVLRAALGQRRLNFLGTSYGTYIGAVYATLFPHHVRRFVLDSVVNPRRDKIWYQSNLDQDPAFERRWNDWKTWVARHEKVYGLGRTGRAVQRHFDAARSAFDHGRVGGSAARRIGAREVLGGFLDVGYDDRKWASRAAALAEFHKGRPQRLTGLVAPSAKSAREAGNSNAVYNAVQCSDAPWPRDWARWDRDNTALARTAPFNTWENAWMNLPCAYWHSAHAQPIEVRSLPGGLPPVLLLAATRDAATPYAGAVETRRRLAGSSLVTEKGSGTHGVAGGNSCVDRHLTRYLLTGTTPGRGATCTARPAPKPVYDRGRHKR